MKRVGRLFISLPWQIAQFLLSKNTTIKGISLFYSLLQNKQVFTKTSTMQAWERDFKMIYTDKQWLMAFKTTYVSTKCANLWELYQKIMLRWYLTPYRLSRFVPGSSPLCWRHCGETGTLFHLMWDCPKVTQYWAGIYDLISCLFWVRLDPSPGMALLSLEMDLVPFHLRNLLSHILLVARLALVRHWKDIISPTRSVVKQIINTHGTYEQLFAHSVGKYPSISSIWEPWNQWYSTLTK